MSFWSHRGRFFWYTELGTLSILSNFIIGLFVIGLEWGLKHWSKLSKKDVALWVQVG